MHMFWQQSIWIEIFSRRSNRNIFKLLSIVHMLVHQCRPKMFPLSWLIWFDFFYGGAFFCCFRYYEICWCCKSLLTYHEFAHINKKKTRICQTGIFCAIHKSGHGFYLFNSKCNVYLRAAALSIWPFTFTVNWIIKLVFGKVFGSSIMQSNWK